MKQVKSALLTRRNTIIFILICGFVLLFIFEMWIWIATNGLPGMQNQAETFVIYLAGKNFVKHGIFKTKPIPDHATGSAPEAHPYYNIHNANFPIFFTYILQKLGITSLSIQHFFCIFIVGIGLFYMFLTIEIYIENTQIALYTLAFSIFSYAGVLIYGPNLYRAWNWLIIFGTLYYIKKYDVTQKKYFFYVGIAFCFFLTWYDYNTIAYISLLIITLALFKFYPNISWKRMVVFVFSGTVVPFVLNRLAVLWAIGLDALLQDIYLMFSTKVLGTPSEQLVQFYKQHNLVLWTEFSASRLFVFTEAMKIVPEGFGKILCSLLTIFFFLCLFFLCLSFFLQKRIGLSHWGISVIRPQEAKFFVASVLAILVTSFVLSTQVYLVYVIPLVPFFIFPISIGSGILFRSLVSNILAGKTFVRVIAVILLLLALGDITRLTYTQLTDTVRVKPMPASHVLSKYKGHSFAVNYPASYVNYFTDEWAKMVWFVPNEKTIDLYIENMDHVFEKDKIVNEEKYKNPDFLLIVDLPYTVKIPKPEKLFREFPLVEKGEDFWIFDLRGRKANLENGDRGRSEDV